MELGDSIYRTWTTCNSKFFYLKTEYIYLIFLLQQYFKYWSKLFSYFINITLPIMCNSPLERLTLMLSFYVVVNGKAYSKMIVYVCIVYTLEICWYDEYQYQNMTRDETVERDTRHYLHSYTHTRLLKRSVSWRHWRLTTLLFLYSHMKYTQTRKMQTKHSNNHVAFSTKYFNNE